MDSGLTALKSFVPSAEVLAPDVSQWSVGMHIQHCCLAMTVVCRSLVASAPPPPRARFNLVTSLVFLTGRVPRGRGKSPEPAIPREEVQVDELGPMLDESERWLEQARQASPDQWYRHFAFGVLDRDRTLKFIGIHNRHHARIVQDILRA